MTKKYIFICLVFIIDIASSFGQSSLTELQKVIKNVDNSWTSEIDLNNKNKHITLVSGESIGVLKLKKDSNEIEYYIYCPLSDTFKSEIKSYHKLASCAFISANNRTLKFKNYILLLPMYPCWISGYSEEEKEFIEKLLIKFK